MGGKRGEGETGGKIKETEEREPGNKDGTDLEGASYTRAAGQPQSFPVAHLQASGPVTLWDLHSLGPASPSLLGPREY